MNIAERLNEARELESAGDFQSAVLAYADAADPDFGATSAQREAAMAALESLAGRPDVPGTHPGFQYEAACALWVCDEARGLAALRRVASLSALGPTRLHAANKLFHVAGVGDGIDAMRGVVADEEGGQTRLLAARLLRSMAPTAVVIEAYAELVRSAALPATARALAWAGLREVAGPKAAAEYWYDLPDSGAVRRIVEAAESQPVRPQGLSLK